MSRLRKSNIITKKIIDKYKKGDASKEYISMLEKKLVLDKAFKKNFKSEKDSK
jgi:hypothetical protein